MTNHYMKLEEQARLDLREKSEAERLALEAKLAYLRLARDTKERQEAYAAYKGAREYLVECEGDIAVGFVALSIEKLNHI